MTRETTIVGGEVRQESVSDEISRAVKGASSQIDRIDHNPLIRLALARVTIRSFAHHVAATFPDDLETLAEEFEKMADMIRDTDHLPDMNRLMEADKADEPALDGETDAEDRKPVREARGRGHTDPQRPEPGGASRKGPRNYGTQRLGKEHTVLRVGGT